MEISNRDRHKIRFVIECQLEAFQREDAVTAFALASSEIKEKFSNPKQFIQMVKTAYPAVYQPRSVIFEDLTFVQGILTQPVLLLSPDGTPVRAVYMMKRDFDNIWRINGCYLVSVESKLM